MVIYIVDVQISFYQYRKSINDIINTSRNNVDIIRTILSEEYGIDVELHHSTNGTIIEKSERTGQK